MGGWDCICVGVVLFGCDMFVVWLLILLDREFLLWYCWLSCRCYEVCLLADCLCCWFGWVLCMLLFCCAKWDLVPRLFCVCLGVAWFVVLRLLVVWFGGIRLLICFSGYCAWFVGVVFGLVACCLCG